MEVDYRHGIGSKELVKIRLGEGAVDRDVELKDGESYYFVVHEDDIEHDEYKFVDYISSADGESERHFHLTWSTDYLKGRAFDNLPHAVHEARIIRNTLSDKYQKKVFNPFTIAIHRCTYKNASDSYQEYFDYDLTITL